MRHSDIKLIRYQLLIQKVNAGNFLKQFTEIFIRPILEILTFSQ